MITFHCQYKSKKIFCSCYTNNTENLNHLNFFCIFAPGLGKNYIKDISEIYQRYTKDIPRIYQRYTKDISEIYQAYLYLR